MDRIRKIATISVICTAALLGSACSLLYPFEGEVGPNMPDAGPRVDAGPVETDAGGNPACESYESLIAFVEIDVPFTVGGMMRSRDVVYLYNNNPFNLVLNGLFLCDRRGGGMMNCISVPDGTFESETSMAVTLPGSPLERSGGEIGLTYSTGGGAVCSYVRWKDSMTEPTFTLAEFAGDGWDEASEVIDSGSLSDTRGLLRMGLGNNADVWGVGTRPAMLPPPSTP
jgi:hypothetical protein